MSLLRGLSSNLHCFQLAVISLLRFTGISKCYASVAEFLHSFHSFFCKEHKSDMIRNFQVALITKTTVFIRTEIPHFNLQHHSFIITHSWRIHISSNEKDKRWIEKILRENWLEKGAMVKGCWLPVLHMEWWAPRFRSWQVRELVKNIWTLEWRVTFYSWKQFNLYVSFLFPFFSTNLRSIKQLALHSAYMPSVMVNIYTLCQVLGYKPVVSFGHALRDLSRLFPDYRLKLTGSLNSWAAPRTARRTRHLPQWCGGAAEQGFSGTHSAACRTSAPRSLATSPAVSLSRKPGFLSALAVEVRGLEIG